MYIQAHRGASAYAPENTAPAFTLAAAMKADGVECDIHLTKDGEIVVCHDHIIDRTSTGTGQIQDYTLTQLKQFDFGVKFDSQFAGTQILTLQEFFEIVRDFSIINIEAKDDSLELLEQTARIAKAYGLEEKILISSFHHKLAAAAKTVCPAFRIGLLYDSLPDDVDAVSYAKSLNADALHPYFGSLTKETVQQANAAGIMTNVWTVDEKSDILRMLDWGVTSVITNRPDVAREAAR